MGVHLRFSQLNNNKQAAFSASNSRVHHNFTHLFKATNSIIFSGDMATSHNDEWGDIPSSSDLFGGDFFGDDELMEMYAGTAGGVENDHNVIASLIGGPPHEPASAAPINSGPVKSSTADDDTSKHPGILVALNAAAMDGAFASSSDFVPVAEVSNIKKAVTVKAKTAPPRGKSQAAKAPTVSSASVARPPATAAAISKRPVATAAAAAQPVSKKRRPSPAKTTAPIQARIATKGGIKVPVPASVKVPSPIVSVTSATSLNRVVSTGAISAIKVEGKPAVVPKTAVAARPAVATALVKKVTAPTPAPVKSAVITPKTVITNAAVANVPATTAKFPALKTTATSTTAGVAIKKPDVPVSSSTAGTVKRAATEADFKDVASAAVSSLMQNASASLNKPGPQKSAVKPSEKVDTSTAHVNALTSQNWVTACNPVPGTTETQSACDKAARNARRASLTQEERAKQNRDRNREHARNTRLRKKAYVEELKRTLTELVAQRDASEVEKRHEAQRNREQREVRFRVMEEFLKLRGRNESNAARWVAILEDGFTFTLPRTSYRHIVDENHFQNDNTSRASLEQVLRGSEAVMEDSKHLSNFLQTIGGDATDATRIQISHRCDRKRFFMDDNVAFMDFAASSVGAVNKGASNEIFFKGSMRASFSPASNKLISVDLTFDTGCIALQLERLGMSTPNEAHAAAAAAEAENLLDSLQMPQIFVDKKNATGTVSVSSDDGERSTDGTSIVA